MVYMEAIMEAFLMIGMAKTGTGSRVRKFKEYIYVVSSH